LFKHEDNVNEITVYLCNCEGKLINSSQLAHPIDPDNYIIESVYVSCDNEIILTRRQWNEWTDLVRDTNVLYIYSADGQLKTTVKFRANEFEFFEFEFIRLSHKSHSHR
jgi:hypothetical protein